MSTVRAKAFDDPDERSSFELGSAAEIHIGDIVVGRQVLEPGWRWSEHVRPMTGTPSCRFHHTGMVLSGRMGVRHDDGTEVEVGPNTVYDVAAGHDAWVVGDEPVVLVEWEGVHRWAEPPAGERILATVLFTDIVESTALAERLGDAEWARLLGEHDVIMRRVIDRHRGTLVSRTGDGLLATFDGAARAIQCAMATHDAVRPLGMELRAGIHTGEIDVLPGTVRGVAVHVAARVMALAGPGETLVTGTTRDLVEPDAFAFDDRGSHELRGVTGARALFAVQPAAG